MKLILFGATGGTGRKVLEQALENGHEVTAFVRRPEALAVQHGNLSVIKGDVLDYNAVEAAIAGHDAVLSTIGAPAHKTGVVRSQGTKNIVNAMQATGVNRFVCQTSLGYGDSKAVLKRTPWIFRFLIAPVLLRKGFADHELQEDHIKSSRLDWVIVRPGNLTDGPLTQDYRHGFAADDPNITVDISRADVADFMLGQLKSKAYLKQTPGLSY